MTKKSTSFTEIKEPNRLKPRERTLQTIIAFAAAYHAEVFDGKLLQFILN